MTVTITGFHLGISSWEGSSWIKGRLIIGNILGGSWVSLGGGGGEEVELSGGEASPAPPSLDETLHNE